jgi:hypothetical protein
VPQRCLQVKVVIIPTAILMICEFRSYFSSAAESLCILAI